MKSNPFALKHNTVRDRGLREFRSTRSEGDTFLFLPIFSGWLGRGLKHRQLYAFSVLIFGLLGILFLRVSYLQVIRGQSFFTRAEQNRIKTVVLRAPRGIIYDRVGEPLVANTVSYTLSLNPQLVKDDAQASELGLRLMELVPDSSEDIRQFTHDYKRLDMLREIASNLTYEESLPLQALAAEYAALQVAYVPARHITNGRSMAHLLGYTSLVTPQELATHPDYGLQEVIGKDGVERFYENSLRGRDGSIQIEVDARGSEKDEVRHRDALRGNDLVLTVDEQAQEQLFSVMTAATRQNGGKPSSAVAMDPNNGEIIALVSIPSYDPNVFASRDSVQLQGLLTDDSRPLFNRAIAGAYPAGSIFKLAVASAGMEERVINATTAINSTGGILLGTHFYPDWKLGGHGVTNVTKAIAESVNTFFYLLGGGDDNVPGLGVDTITRYAKRFGFGTPTGVDLAGESDGFIPSREWKERRGERWYQGDTYNLSIGQGDLLVTPVQIARYVSVFANGGTLVTPHVGKEILSGADRRTLAYGTTRTDISQNTLSIIRQGMRRTVISGTAQGLQAVPVPVAAKTGTAQFSSVKDAHSWLAAFAPYDKPSLVVVTQVEEGDDRGYAVAAARDFMKWYFDR